MCSTCADGYGWTEPNVFYLEMENGFSGTDLTPGSSGNQYIEWIWGNHDGSFTVIDTLEYVELCQGISPTVTGLTARVSTK